MSSMFMKNMIQRSSVGTSRLFVKSCGNRKPRPLSSTIAKRASAANIAEGSILASRARTRPVLLSSSANSESDSGSQTIRTGHSASGRSPPITKTICQPWAGIELGGSGSADSRPQRNRHEHQHDHQGPAALRRSIRR